MAINFLNNLLLNNRLEIIGKGTSDNTPQLVIASGEVDKNSILHFSDDDGGQICAIGAFEGNILTFAALNDLVFNTGSSSITSTANTRMTITASGSLRLSNSAGTYLSIASSSNVPYINTGTSGGTVQFGAPATNTTNISVQGSATANSFVKNGGTSSQFLKANGSVDSNTYLTGFTVPYTEQIALSDETTALTTGTSKVTFRCPGNINVTNFRSSCATAPTGSKIIVDINVSGVSILATKLTIDAGEKTSRTASVPFAFATGADDIGDDLEITIDIDGVGSTIAGAGLKLIMFYNYTPVTP